MSGPDKVNSNIGKAGKIFDYLLRQSKHQDKLKNGKGKVNNVDVNLENGIDIYEWRALGLGTDQAFYLWSVGGDASKVNDDGTVNGDGKIDISDYGRMMKEVIHEIAKGLGIGEAEIETIINEYNKSDYFDLADAEGAVEAYLSSVSDGKTYQGLIDDIKSDALKKAVTTVLNGKLKVDLSTKPQAEILKTLFLTLSFLGAIDKPEEFLSEASGIGKPKSNSVNDFFKWLFGDKAEELGLIGEEKVKGTKNEDSTSGEVIPGRAEFEKKVMASDGKILANLSPLEYKDAIGTYVSKMENRYKELKNKVDSLDSFEKDELVPILGELIKYQSIQLEPAVVEKVKFAIEHKDLLPEKALKILVSTFVIQFYTVPIRKNLNLVKDVLENYQKTDEGSNGISLGENRAITAESIGNDLNSIPVGQTDKDILSKSIDGTLIAIQNSDDFATKISMAIRLIYLIKQNPELESELKKMGRHYKKEKVINGDWDTRDQFYKWLEKFVKIQKE